MILWWRSFRRWVESGATSICLLAVSEQAKGLFQRAFVFDGSPEFADDTPNASRALAKALLKQWMACDTIGDRITGVEGLLDYMVK